MRAHLANAGEGTGDPNWRARVETGQAVFDLCGKREAESGKETEDRDRRSGVRGQGTPDVMRPEETVVKKGDPRIEELVKTLTGKGWMKKKEIMKLLPTWHERVMRAAKAASGGRIISSWAKGYCLIWEATDGEYLASVREMGSRAAEIGGYLDEMLARRAEPSAGSGEREEGSEQD